jgi:hypothetical protein
MNMAGVPKGATDIIPQKYQLAMAKAAQEGQAEVRMALSAWGGLLVGCSYLIRSDQGGNPRLRTVQRFP